jgi:hypothetical protein
MFRLAIPLLHPSNSTCGEGLLLQPTRLPAGIRPLLRQARPGPCNMGLTRDRIWLHVSSFCADGISGGVVNVIVDDVDDLQAELVAKNVHIDTGPVDQTWGSREMHVKVADGNCIRFIEQ